jgi:hypothetical protein
LNLRSRDSLPDILYPFLGCAALLACICAAFPFADAGFDDDWNYAWVALRLKETGQINYGGCCNAMILFQSFWGAAWIRAFGFSFNLLRIVSIPFSLGFVWLVYFLGRKAGLARHLAVFGALIVGTSPLFLPLAGSFMTEPYACFFGALCIYAAICSAEAARSATATRWLWVLAAAGICGGSDRQTVWAASLGLIPYLFWIRRADRRFSIHAAASYAVSLATLAFLIHRFSLPYAPVISGPALAALVSKKNSVAIIYMVSLALVLFLISWPALLCLAPLWKKLTAAGIVGWAAVSGVLTVAAVVAASNLGVGAGVGVVPFLGNILTFSGIMFEGVDALGLKPTILPISLRLILTCVLIFSVIATILLRKDLSGKVPRVPGTVFLIFSVTYVPLLVPGALASLVFDRYMLPLFPLAVISMLALQGARLKRIPAVAWVCLIVFAAYSMTTVHDYFSALRARVVAAEALMNQGIPRNHISAGHEFDGFTQMEDAGHMESVSEGIYAPWNSANSFWLWNRTKDVHPDYIAFTSRASDPPGPALLSIPFTTWLPPFRRSAVILRRRDLPKEDAEPAQTGVGSSEAH